MPEAKRGHTGPETRDNRPKKRKHDDNSLDDDVEKITRGELAKGHSMCGWCDTPIEKGSPRVVRKMYHAAGKFERSNGAKGFNPGGVMPEFLHPQCAFLAQQQKSPKKRVRCQDCGNPIHCGQWAFCSMLGAAGKRCTQSNRDPTWFCIECLKLFFERHTALLKGQISAASSLDEAVSWPGFSDRASPFDPRPTGAPNRPLPKEEETRARLRAAFSPLEPADGEGDTAVERHRALQRAIKAAPTAPTKAALARGASGTSSGKK